MLRHLIKHILPDFLLKWYRRRKSEKRLKTLEKDKASGTILRFDDLVSLFTSLGIVPGDVVMLHSSLSKIGYVEGGADAIIDSILTCIGKEGTLAMPSFPGMGFNADYLKTHTTFNVSETPSRMGLITETFRKRPGVKRSWHPTEPLCALGKTAHYLTETHHLQETPYHNQSPFFKLCEHQAKIILLGVDFHSLTNLHTVEDAVPSFKYPVYLKERVHCQIIHPDGTLDYKAAVHDPVWSKKRRCNELIPLFLNAGFTKQYAFGKTSCYVIEAGKMHEWMLKNYIEKGVTMYTPEGETIT